MRKRWYKSKTLWVNIATAVASVTLILSTDVAWKDYAQYLLMANALVNATLRLMTDEGIE